MSKFDADFYSRFRPYYPGELFAGLGPALLQQGFSAPYAIADIGCGTGHSAASLLRSGIAARVHGVDPDPAMLQRARQICPEALYTQGSGEVTGLDSGLYDAVTVGSAFHWMDPLLAREEFLRILRPGGVILAYEYQFPKAPTLPLLNEWIRREFNLRWKAPEQKPRGNFEAVTACFRTDPRLAVLRSQSVPMVQALDAGALTGLLLSQSRVLHYENGMDETTRWNFHHELGERILALMGGQAGRFDFNLQMGLFAS